MVNEPFKKNRFCQWDFGNYLLTNVLKDVHSYSQAISYRAKVSPDGVWTMKSDTGKGVPSSLSGQDRI